MTLHCSPEGPGLVSHSVGRLGAAQQAQSACEWLSALEPPSRRLGGPASTRLDFGHGSSRQHGGSGWRQPVFCIDIIFSFQSVFFSSSLLLRFAGASWSRPFRPEGPISKSGPRGHDWTTSNKRRQTVGDTWLGARRAPRSHKLKETRARQLKIFLFLCCELFVCLCPSGRGGQLVAKSCPPSFALPH